MTERHSVLVLGLDERNERMLTDACGDIGCTFRPLLSVEELVDAHQLPLRRLLGKATEEVQRLEGRVDAIVGYWDFPVSSMVPMLCERFGLRSAGLRSILACEHKYWSRLEQAKVIDEYPSFGVVGRDDREPPQHVGYPLWLKPVKGFSSELAFYVENQEEFREALQRIGAGIERVGAPFQFLLDQVDLPAEVEQAGGQACLAEAAVGGQQLTVEGYSTENEIVIYGIIDSETYEGTPSFECYRYPSTIPEQVQQRLARISRRVIERIELRNVAFNIEYFWDPDSGAINLLEVNPRHSQAHAKLFEYVDGVPNHRVMVRLALGLEVDLRRGQGPYRTAATFFVRRFSDAVVRRAPTQREIDELRGAEGDCVVDVVAHEGDRLSDLPEQDSYSYAYATIHIGADSEEALRKRYERVLQALPFEFDDE